MALKPPEIKVDIQVPDLKNFFNVFRKSAQVNATKTSREAAEEVLKEFHDILDNQKYKWEPLSPAYEEFKAQTGLDPRIMIATSFYKDHIEIWEEGGHIYLGAKPGVIHKPSGMPLVKIMRIHEYGTKTVPARPLWRPLLSKFVRKNKRLANMYAAAVERDLKRALRSVKNK